MTDWQRALADAFREHEKVGGSSGSCGSSCRNASSDVRFGNASHGTTPEPRVVPVVPAADDPRGLTDASRKHLEVGGSCGSCGSRRRNASNAAMFGDAACGTTPEAHVVPVVPPPDPQGSARRETPVGTTIDVDASLAASPSIGHWQCGLAKLNPAEPPFGFTPDRWFRLIDGGTAFLDAWGRTAAALGWSTLDVFGVHPEAPAARYDVMGLVPLLGDGELMAVEATHATMRMPTGSKLTYLRRPRPGAVPIWCVPIDGGDPENIGAATSSQSLEGPLL